VRAAAWRVWAWPLTLALLTAIGLLSALVADGWGDALSWFCLAAPLAVSAWHLLKPAESANSS
jgi:hypothetical protein